MICVTNTNDPRRLILWMSISDVTWQATCSAMRADIGGENKKVEGYVILALEILRG